MCVYILLSLETDSHWVYYLQWHGLSQVTHQQNKTWHQHQESSWAKWKLSFVPVFFCNAMLAFTGQAEGLFFSVLYITMKFYFGKIIRQGDFTGSQRIKHWTLFKYKRTCTNNIQFSATEYHWNSYDRWISRHHFVHVNTIRDKAHN